MTDGEQLELASEENVMRDGEKYIWGDLIQSNLCSPNPGPSVTLLVVVC